MLQLDDVVSFTKKMEGIKVIMIYNIQLAFVKQFKKIADTLQKYVLDEDTEKFRVMVELYNKKMDNFIEDLVPGLVQKFNLIIKINRN